MEIITITMAILFLILGGCFVEQREYGVAIISLGMFLLSVAVTLPVNI